MGTVAFARQAAERAGSMKVVGRKVLEEFSRQHSDARSQIDAWLQEAKASQWSKPQDIKERYASASFLSDNRVVFNVKGNSYRLEIKVSYKSQVVLITRIGTHAQYSRWHS
jgi:mRNA interferase HigB